MRESKKQMLDGVEGVKTAKVVGRSTLRIEYTDGREAVRLHHTDITTKYPDGRVVLNSGGWMTPTTKERLAFGLPDGWRVYQENKVWYLYRANGIVDPWKSKEIVKYPFRDGITIHPDNAVTDAGPDAKQFAALDKKIRKYVTGYVEKLFSGEMGTPGGGDCRTCSTQVVGEEGSWGESSKDKSHLLNHFDEDYYVPSMVCNAVRAFPVSVAAERMLGYLFGQRDQKDTLWVEISKEQIRKSLRRYLRRQLGLAA